MKPVIALLTDFGTRDHYVGAMSGVVLGICPDATPCRHFPRHAPQDILGGALELAAAFKYFPPAPFFSASSIPVSVPRDAESRPKRASAIRRAGQRSVDGGLQRCSAKARRGVDRAELRAADDESHV